MNAQELERWRKVRGKGEYRYVLKCGLFWALCMGVGGFLFGLIFKRYLNNGWDLFIFEAALKTILFFLCGTLLGIWTWRGNEKKYSQAITFDRADSFNRSAG